MKKLFLMLSIFIATTAFAEPFSLCNFYIEGFGGVNFVNTFKKDELSIEFDTGYIFGAALGYRFSPFFRLEAEGAYRKNSIHGLTVEAQGIDFTLPGSGDLEKITLMANGILDFPLPCITLTPYLGGGIGGRWDRESFTLSPINTGEVTIIFEEVVDKARGFAYQVFGGLSYCLNSRIEMAVEYRYLDGPKIQGNHSIDLTLKRYF